MEDRIRKFMEYKGISPSELADSIGVQRSNVTHVLHGRNNPSLPFIEKMLLHFPELNAEWFMRGTGNMLKDQAKPKTLFDFPLDSAPTPPSLSKSSEKPSVDTSFGLKPEPLGLPSSNTNELFQTPANDNKPESITENMNRRNVVQDQFFSADKPIERIIVFFADQSFKVYSPSR